MTITDKLKAENWNFNFNIISEQDKENLLRKYHGNDSYETMHPTERESWDAMLFMELNALLANGLIKTGVQEYVNKETGEQTSFYVVLNTMD